MAGPSIRLIFHEGWCRRSGPPIEQNGNPGSIPSEIRPRVIVTNTSSPLFAKSCKGESSQEVSTTKTRGWVLP